MPALKIAPPSAKQIADFQQANGLTKVGRFQEAINIFLKLLKARPDDPYLLAELGTVCLNVGDYQQAAKRLVKSLLLLPNQPNGHCNLGAALTKLGRLEEALRCFEKALALNPQIPAAHYNRGNVLLELKQHQAAIQAYAQALALQPDYVSAYINLGLANDAIHQYQAAMESYDKAIALQADSAQAHYNRGNTLQHLQLYELAVAAYQQAIDLEPDYAEAHCGQGLAYNELKRYVEALPCFERTRALKPDYDFLAGYRLLAKMQVCNWQDFSRDLTELAAGLERGARIATPFAVQALTGNPRWQRIAAELWVKLNFPADQSLPPLSNYAGHEKIRLGYFSGDFRQHPVAYLTAELFEQHDRNSFELIGFSFGPDTGDAMRLRLQAGFDRFLDVKAMSDQDIAQLARALEIDIAIDLGGHTAHSRTGVFALRAAPLQVGYIGYLGTMGAEYMDYLLADRVIIPASTRAHYVESIVYLPSYQVNDSQRQIASAGLSRQELGLPEQGFVFCCFNNTYKLSPAVFEIWMRILQSVAGSVLMLYADNPLAVDNLRREAQRHEINPERLIFGLRLPMPEYLARYQSADLFLDTQPYNAGATASDALWAGLPVLTCPGDSFPGRVAASLLTALDLPELIAESPQHYEQLAIELATDAEKYAAIKNKLSANRLTTPLFDTPAFTRHLETAYQQMHRRQQAGLAPEDINEQ